MHTYTSCILLTYISSVCRYKLHPYKQKVWLKVSLSYPPAPAVLGYRLLGTLVESKDTVPRPSMGKCSKSSLFRILEEPIILGDVLDPGGTDSAIFARNRGIITLDSLDHHIDEAVGVGPIRRSCTNIAWVDSVPALVRRSDLDGVLLKELGLRMIFETPKFSHRLIRKP